MTSRDRWTILVGYPITVLIVGMIVIHGFLFLNSTSWIGFVYLADAFAWLMLWQAMRSK